MRTGKITKEKLLNEATKLIQRKGFGATSVNDLLLAAGIKRWALYHHFPGKDDLGLAVLDCAKVSFFENVDTALDAPTPKDGLERFLAMVFERHRAKGFVGGCIFGNTALEMSDAGCRYADCVNMFFQEWTAKIEAVIKKGQDCGQIRTDTTAFELAEIVISTIEGGIMLSRLKKEERPLKISLEAIRKMLFVSQKS